MALPTEQVVCPPRQMRQGSAPAEIANEKTTTSVSLDISDTR